MTENDNQPLAHQLRPQNISDIFGQEHLTDKNRPLWKIINGGVLYSFILIGPPGIGRTSLAEIIAKNVSAKLIKLSAVSATVKDIREVADIAKNNAPNKTILLLDEIHRFSKTQQDQLLPHLETGLFYLIGATTENLSQTTSKCMQAGFGDW